MHNICGLLRNIWFFRLFFFNDVTSFDVNKSSPNWNGFQIITLTKKNPTLTLYDLHASEALSGFTIIWKTFLKNRTENCTQWISKKLPIFTELDYTFFYTWTPYMIRSERVMLPNRTYKKPNPFKCLLKWVET